MKQNGKSIARKIKLTFTTFFYTLLSRTNYAMEEIRNFQNILFSHQQNQNKMWRASSQ